MVSTTRQEACMIHVAGADLVTFDSTDSLAAPMMARRRWGQTLQPEQRKKNNWESLLPVDRDFLETRMWKILRLLSTVSTKVRWLFWSFNAIPNIQSVVAWDDPKHGQTRSDPCPGSKYCRWWANPLKNMSIRQLGPIYPKIGFNIKFDIKHLFYSAFELDQTGSRNFHDIHSAPGGRRYPRCLARKQE
jgi:hypothetical protein